MASDAAKFPPNQMGHRGGERIVLSSGDTPDRAGTRRSHKDKGDRRQKKADDCVCEKEENKREKRWDDCRRDKDWDDFKREKDKADRKERERADVKRERDRLRPLGVGGRGPPPLGVSRREQERAEVKREKGHPGQQGRGYLSDDDWAPRAPIPGAVQKAMGRKAVFLPAAFIAQTEISLELLPGEEIPFALGIGDDGSSIGASRDGCEFTLTLPGMYRFEFAGDLVAQKPSDLTVSIVIHNTEFREELRHFAATKLGTVGPGERLITAVTTILPIRRAMTVSVRAETNVPYILAPGARLQIQRVA